MKTLPTNDHLSQAADRADREYHERFKQDMQKLLRKQRDAKEQCEAQASAAEMPRRAQSGDN